MHGYRFIPQLNLLMMAFGERVDDTSLLEHLVTVYDDERFVPGMDEISSFLATRTVAVTASGLREIARSFPRPGHERAAPNCVAVVTRTQLGRGLSRLYSAYAGRGEGVSMETFASLAEAGDWLDYCRGRPTGTTAAAVSASETRS